jgi:hypothetical protein
MELLGLGKSLIPDELIPTVGKHVVLPPGGCRDSGSSVQKMNWLYGK